MSARINTILIIGATSGIGEAMARRFHSMGKKVIAAGISGDKLAQLAQELPGLETRTVGILDAPKRGTTDNSASLSLSQWDVTDLANLQSHVKGILADFPQPRYRLHQRRDPKPLHDPPASRHRGSGPRGHDQSDRTEPDRPVLCPAPPRPGPVRHQDDPLPHKLLPGVLPAGLLPDLLRHQGRHLRVRQDRADAVGFHRLQEHERGGGRPTGTYPGLFLFHNASGFSIIASTPFFKKKLYLFLLQSLQFNMTPKRSVSLSKKGKQKKGGGALTPPYHPPQYVDTTAERTPPRPDRRAALQAARRRPSRPCRSRRTWRGFFAALERTARRKRELGARGVEVWRGTLYEAMGLAI